MDAKGQRSPNRLKQELAAGRVCLGATIISGSPVVAELLSRVGFDWLWLEMEHTTVSEDGVLAMLQATNGSDVSTVVRVPWNDKTLIKRAVDAGPDAILIPQINTREEAEYAVRAMKYPPVGERGAGLARAQAYGLAMGEYYKSANDELDPADDRAHRGRREYRRDPGRPRGRLGDDRRTRPVRAAWACSARRTTPRWRRRRERVLAACRRAAIPCGIVALDPDQANRRIEQGFTNIVVAIDVLMLIGRVEIGAGQGPRPDGA